MHVFHNVPESLEHFRVVTLGFAMLAMSSSCRTSSRRLPKARSQARPKSSHAGALSGRSIGRMGPCDARNWEPSPKSRFPKGYRFTGHRRRGQVGRADAQCSQSQPPGRAHADGRRDRWTIVFSYEDSGHVPDDEKGNLDAAAILESIREGSEQANNTAAARAGKRLELVGWKSPPAYEDETHHLVWALRVRGEGGEGINYNTKILGRTGVMSANLLVGNEDFDTTVPVAKQSPGRLSVSRPAASIPNGGPATRLPSTG